MRSWLPLAFCALILASAPSAALAQSSDPGSAPQPAPQTKTQDPKTAQKKKPPKVWTNEEIESVHGGVSVVGSEGEQESKNPAVKPEKKEQEESAKHALVERYRRQIQELHAQIDAADRKIAQLKAFKGENTTPSGGINPYQGYNMVPPEEQVKQLEEQKKRVQGKIEDLENEARKNGIDPGDLR